MAIEVILHGKIEAWGCWGDQGQDVESVYLRKFHKSSENPQDNHRLEIEVSRGSFFYNYIVNHGVSTKARDGGYFGITLKSNQFHPQIREIYEILDVAFRTYATSKILKRLGNHQFEYIISSFNESLHKEIEMSIEPLISLLPPPETIPTTSGALSKQALRCNINELNIPEIKRIISEGGSVSVSSHFPTQKETQIINKCVLEKKQIKEQYENEKRSIQESSDQRYQGLLKKYNSAEQSRDELESELAQKKQEISSISSDLKKTTDKVKSQERELEALKSKDEISKITEIIKTCIRGELTSINSSLKKFDQDIKEANNNIRQIQETLTSSVSMSQPNPIQSTGEVPSTEEDKDDPSEESKSQEQSTDSMGANGRSFWERFKQWMNKLRKLFLKQTTQGDKSNAQLKGYSIQLEEDLEQGRFEEGISYSFSIQKEGEPLPDSISKEGVWSISEDGSEGREVGNGPQITYTPKQSVPQLKVKWICNEYPIEQTFPKAN